MLHCAQRPLPLRRSVTPPLLTATAWSACRIGAPHQGVRQIWSRAARNMRAVWGKSRRRASVASRSPVAGSANRRRTQTLVVSLAVSRSRAMAAGRGPWPMRWAGSWSPSARARSVMTRCSSMAACSGSPSPGVMVRLHELVGHDLAFAAVVVGVAVGGHRGAVQDPVDADAFFDGEECGHVGHAVGGGADGDPPVGDGFAGAVGGAVGVEAVRPAAGLAFGLGVAPPGELVGDGGVDLGVVFLGQVGGFPGDQGGPPFAAVAAFQGLEHQWQFVDEGGGEADVPVAFVGAVPAGEADLGAHGPPGVGGFRPGLDQFRSLGDGEGVGDAGLPGADRGLECFEGGDLVDVFGVGAGGVERGQHRDERDGLFGARHVFDSTSRRPRRQKVNTDGSI